MRELEGFSERLEIPNIPGEPGVCIVEDEDGEALQVFMSNNVRRRIGEKFDSGGALDEYGPKIYETQQRGRRLFVRWWRLTPYYQAEFDRIKKRLDVLAPDRKGKLVWKVKALLEKVWALAE